MKNEIRKFVEIDVKKVDENMIEGSSRMTTDLNGVEKRRCEMSCIHSIDSALRRQGFSFCGKVQVFRKGGCEFDHDYGQFEGEFFVMV
jgi:hypothetical protein